MVLDTSALLAVLLEEPEAPKFAQAIAADPRRLLSAFSALETAVVIEAKKGEGAGREFGKGRHPAGLNIGDCCAYALAGYTGEPLLFKGEDFRKTDVHQVPES